MAEIWTVTETNGKKTKICKQQQSVIPKLQEELFIQVAESKNYSADGCCIIWLIFKTQEDLQGLLVPGSLTVLGIQVFSHSIDP